MSGVQFTIYQLKKKTTTLTSDGFLFLMRHRGFGLRSASVRAEQTSPGRLAPRPTTLSGVRTLRCLALKNASLRETFFNETSGIRTPDNLIKSQVLYHLSYTPLTGVAGLEPAVQESESCALPLGDTPSMRQLVYIIICFRQLSTLFLNFFKFIFQE